MICFYHDDMDGYASAAIVRKAFPEVKLQRIQYGDIEKIDFAQFKLNMIKEQDIVIVDFSFPKAYMNALKELYDREQIKSVVWIDHHISAKKENPDLWEDISFGGIRKIEQESAALLTWQYYFPVDEESMTLIFISCYDTWKFHGKETEIKQYISLLNVCIGRTKEEPLSPDWDLFFKADYKISKEELIIGQFLLEAANQRADDAIKDGRVIDFRCHKTLCVNSRNDISLIGEKIYNMDYEIGLIWCVRNGVVTASLRSRKVDVSELAKTYGGGGHKSAAGFTMKIHDFAYCFL